MVRNRNRNRNMKVQTKSVSVYSYNRVLDSYISLFNASEFKGNNQVEDSLSNCLNDCPVANGRIDCLSGCLDAHCHNQCWDPACDC